MADQVALTDSEDEPSPGKERSRSLQARYDALDAMSKASLTGEAARQLEGSMSPPSALAMDLDEESQHRARTASFELQYDALDAGAAVAAVAAASPMGGAAGGTGGFHAKDVATMLSQRAEWMNQLGSSVVLCSDDLSDQSSEWGGSDAASVGEAGSRVPRGLAGLAAAALLGVGMDGSVDEAPLQFQRARQRFEGLRLGAGDGAREGLASGLGRPDPPARRLRRLRAEAGAFCGWAEQRSAGAAGSSDGALPLARETSQLGQDARELAALVQRAVGAAAVDAMPKQVWLPPSERLDVCVVQQLLKLSRVPASATAASQELNHGATEAPGGGLVYELSAGGAGGWLAASELGTLQALEARVAHLRTALGAGPAPQGGSLAAAAAQLHRRLDALQQVSDPDACERLRTSVQLLSAEIDVAASEARHLEALEAEEREGDLGADLAVEETPADYVLRLHDEVASLDAVVLRVADIDRQLGEQELLIGELSRFATDIASAEARALQAGQVLRAAAKAAERMRQAADSSREQLQRNAAALEAKLAALAAAPQGAGDAAAA